MSTTASLTDRVQQIRLLEALLFASSAPVPEADLKKRLPEGTDVRSLLKELAALYEERGVILLQSGRLWAFRTAPDLAPYLRLHTDVPRKLSRAGIEVLSIIAYHQPITRAEIEEMRGVALSKGTLDILVEAGWVRPRGRRKVPGRPMMWGTSEAFLDHFGLRSLDELPGLGELKAAGLLERRQGLGTLAMRPEEAQSTDDAGPETDEDSDSADNE